MVRLGALFIWCLLFYFFFVFPLYQTFLNTQKEFFTKKELLQMKEENTLYFLFKDDEGVYWDVVETDGYSTISLKLLDETQGYSKLKELLGKIGKKIESFAYEPFEDSFTIKLFFSDE